MQLILKLETLIEYTEQLICHSVVEFGRKKEIPLTPVLSTCHEGNGGEKELVSTLLSCRCLMVKKMFKHGEKWGPGNAFMLVRGAADERTRSPFVSPFRGEAEFRLGVGDQNRRVVISALAKHQDITQMPVGGAHTLLRYLHVVSGF